MKSTLHRLHEKERERDGKIDYRKSAAPITGEKNNI
jgi:hypothetical protein